MPVKKVTKKKIVVSKVTSRLASARSKNKISVRVPRQARDKLKSRTTTLSVPVYSLAGRVTGTLSLPKEIFGQKVNKKLLAQAVRVYMTNQKNFTASTKTRGEVRGSTAKVWRQKGTGRARHGARTAPIFVGGGVVFGPKPRKVRLDLPKKMRKAALLSALSAKLVDKEILGISGFEKATGKTKEMAQFLMKLSEKGTLRQDSGQEVKSGKSKSTLIVTADKMDNVVRGVRNISGIDVMPASLINAYEVLRHQMLLLTKDAVSVILGSEATPESKQSKDSGPASQGEQARMTKVRH